MSFGLEMSFDRSVLERLFDSLKTLEDGTLPDAFLAYAGEELLNIAHEAFDNQASPSGEKWKEWTEEYAALSKKDGGPGSRILDRNHDLYRSITYEVRNGRLYMGSNMVYAARHQYGDAEYAATKKGMPPRPYIGLSDDFSDRLFGDDEVVKELFSL